MNDLSIKVLIVEDLRSVAMALKRVLAPFHVVGVASTGAEALRLQARLQPDVITMDIQLPDVDGLELTRQILRRRPVPVVIVSSRVTADSQALVFEALRSGAYDVVPKGNLVAPADGTSTAEKLVRLVRVAGNKGRPDSRRSRVAVSGTAERLDASAQCTRGTTQRFRAVAIGASTGGPALLRDVFAALRTDFPLPIFLAQHMAEGFMEGFVKWLDTQSPLAFRIARSGEEPRPGVVYCPPSLHHLSLAGAGTLQVTPSVAESPTPSVDHLFRSVVRVYGAQGIFLLLTGMGRDGAGGLLEARRIEAMTAAQDEETSVVFSMPGEAIECGAARYVLPAPALPAWLNQQAQLVLR